MAAKKLAAFRALKMRDKKRVLGYLRRGEAPQDPALAEATTQYGEGVLRFRKSRVFNRAFMLLFLSSSTFFAIRYISAGRVAGAAFEVAVTLALIGIVARSPIFWPQRVRESVAATRSQLNATGLEEAQTHREA